MNLVSSVDHGYFCREIGKGYQALQQQPTSSGRADEITQAFKAPSEPTTRYHLSMSEEKKKYVAFISYASRYAPWVERLHHDLERSLKALGANDRVFFDRKDLVSGPSWVDQLERGIEQTHHLILVLTPEALASEWVGKERSSFLALSRARRLHVVRLVECSLPAFLSDLQYIDFVDCDDTSYREGLRRLLIGLLAKDARAELSLPSDLSTPAAPQSTLPEPLRKRIVDCLTPALTSRLSQRAIESELGLERGSLDGTPGKQAAERALVLATKADDPLTAAHRTVATLLDQLGEDLPPETTTELRRLHDELSELKERSPEQGLLGAWLAKLRGDHQRLVPYFQQRTELDLLDRVYVQLELRRDHLGLERAEKLARKVKPGAAGETGDIEKLELAKPLTIRQVLELDPAEHEGISGRWVILGDPGAGKTTLLRHLAAELARETPSRWVPVFESLPRLMREPQWLLDRFERQMRRAGQPSDGLAAVLDRAGQEGRLLVLLDGLDEVPRDDRDDAEALLRQVSSRWPDTPILVTSRPIGFRRPGADFHELELLPFDDERRRDFLARWFGRVANKPDHRRAAKAAKGLDADASLRELASNPLYLTLMALLIEQGTSPAANRTQLYDQVFDLLLDGKHRQPSRPIDAKLGVRQVLRHLAFEMTRANLDAEPVEQIEARLYKQELAKLREPLECVPRWRLSLRPFLTDLAEQTGILGEHDGPSTEWRFWHRTFREALAAEELARRYETGGQEEILAHAREIAGDESRWAEPYALLTGQIDAPDALVKALVKENAALGLRALATAQTLADETIVEVLELSDSWEERSKVFLSLPDKLDDPLRTLALVDRLRQRTRNGNDLFHLDLVVSAVTERWPDAARQVDELRARFYDHIPAPPAELFETVETKDGQVPLWCPIPKGRFLMGSPDDEEGRYDFEGPQHEVVVASAFQLAAVPVTQAQYRVFDPDHTSFFDGDQRPVERVTWYQAMAFCRWLASHAATKGARLPMEEEWEYACRAGTISRFWSGDAESDLEQVGWFGEGPSGTTHPVGGKLANPWGLYDVHGNVYEWTLSPWTDDYSEQAKEDDRTVDPASFAADLAEPRDHRVIRGGSYWSDPRNVRSAYRSLRDPWIVDLDLGFRVLLPFAPSDD